MIPLILRPVLKFIFFPLFFFSFLPPSCEKEAPTPKTSLRELEERTFSLKTEGGQHIQVSLAIGAKTKAQGLSGIKDSDFSNNQGMLFIFDKEDMRRFWMPNTYFNLDIIFLNKDLTITGLEKNVPHHPGLHPPIPTTGDHRAKYVLEIKARSPLSESIRMGQKIIWNSTPSLWQIEQDIRLRQ